MFTSHLTEMKIHLGQDTIQIPHVFTVHMINTLAVRYRHLSKVLGTLDLAFFNNKLYRVQLQVLSRNHNQTLPVVKITVSKKGKILLFLENFC